MPNEKITDQAEDTTPASNDWVVTVDVSDTTDSPEGTNKKVQVGNLGSASIPNDSVTNAKLANMAQATIKGRASGAGTGDPTDLTPTEVKTVLAIASTDVSDFGEAVEDRIGTKVVAGTGISVSYNDTTGETEITNDDPGSGVSLDVDGLSAPVYAADGGSTDAYAITLSPAPSGYTTGTHYRFKANTANTGACTLNVNSLGAKTIKKVQGGITTDLADNDIRAGQFVDVVYDGTNLQMQSTLGNAASGGYSTVQDEGVSVTQRSIIDFAGAGVSVIDSGGTKTLVTIPGGGSGGVSRGSFASRPAAGNAGTLYKTTDGILEFYDDGSNWHPYFGSVPLTQVPVLSNWTQVNMGSATIADWAGAIQLNGPALAGDSFKMAVKSAPSTPYTITAAFLIANAGINFSMGGLIHRNSSSGDLRVYGVTRVNGEWLGRSFHSGPTGAGNSRGTDVSRHVIEPSPLLWLRFADNGTTVTYSFSVNGFDWVVWGTGTHSEDFTPDQVGFGINVNNSTRGMTLTLLSWKEE